MSTKVHLVKAMVCPVVMYGCESWTIKKAECWRIYAFELWCWRLLRVHWTARRSNQSILKETSPGCSLEVLILKLKLQYFGHLMQRANSFERPWCLERLKARGEGNNRGWDGWMASPTRWTWVWMNSGSWWWTGRPGMVWFMGSQRAWHDWATGVNWTKTMTTTCGNIPNLLPHHIFEGKDWNVVCWRESSLTPSKSWVPKTRRPPTIHLNKACPRGSLWCLWLNTMVSQLLRCQSLAIQHLRKKKCSHWQYRCLWKKASVFKTKRC